MAKMRGRIAARKSCAIHGDNGCEIQGEAGATTRAQEKREWRVTEQMAREPWTFLLACGCTVKAVVAGICVHAVMDGLHGTEVKCPEHGWQRELRP